MKLLRDTRLIFGSAFTETLRNPIWIIVGLTQPIMYLLLYGPLLENVPGMGGANAYNTFVPGLLIMTALFSSLFVGFDLITKLRNGVIERLRVTPVSRLAIVLGMVAKDVLMLLLQCTVLCVASLLFGFRPDLLGIVALYALMILIGVAMSSLSYGLALAVRDENALASSVNMFSLPLLLLSGVFLPLTFAPQWMQTVAQINPLTHAIDAARALIVGTFSEPSVLIGFSVFAVLTVLFAMWVNSAIRQATA
ncbi:MAG: ABC transporter permease [Chloroflexota bacterium]|nr:ABC transporter permease [Chloroflexota bacterium]